MNWEKQFQMRNKQSYFVDGSTKARRE
jgi:hypothetical protein